MSDTDSKISWSLMLNHCPDCYAKGNFRPFFISKNGSNRQKCPCCKSVYVDGKLSQPPER